MIEIQQFEFRYSHDGNSGEYKFVRRFLISLEVYNRKQLSVNITRSVEQFYWLKALNSKGEIISDIKTVNPFLYE